jgi:tRNA1Val (adenine37-N6)-methyltransferase
VANSYFEFKKFTIHQDRCAFKVTTDACVLGAYVHELNPDSICDIGTGTGIIALMLAQKFPGSKIDAIEIDTSSAIQARENVDASPWSERIMVINQSIQDFSTRTKKKFMLIVCNPPYYEDHLRSKDNQKNLTKHNYTISIKELANSINILLKDQGVFYTIMPAFSFCKLREELERFNIRLFDKLGIHSKMEKPLYRYIGGFCRKTVHLKEDTLIIYNKNGKYSESFKKLLKDYYLAF